MSLASRWTLTPAALAVRVNQKTWWSAAADICPGLPGRLELRLVIRLVHESTHSDVIHDAQG